MLPGNNHDAYSIYGVYTVGENPVSAGSHLSPVEIDKADISHGWVCGGGGVINACMTTIYDREAYFAGIMHSRPHLQATRR